MKTSIRPTDLNYESPRSLVSRRVPAFCEADNDPALLFARASSLFASGRLAEARETCLRAEAAGGRHAALYTVLGWSCYGIGDFDQAAASMRRAITADPGLLEARHGLSEALMAQGRLDEVVANCKGTLERWPDDFYSHSWLGQCRLKQNDAAAAGEHFRCAIATNERDSSVWINLSASLGLQCRVTEALQALDQAERLEATTGEDSDSFFASIAVGRRSLGQLEEAIDICERTLAKQPTVEGHGAYSHALLCAGRMAEGWDHYEFRWLKEPFRSIRPGGQKSTWTGQDLQDKTVVLRVEQGFGDAIQFIRYARHVKALGAIVLLDVFRELKQLASSCPGIDQAVTRDEPLPPFDYYVHLLSLPRVFGTDVDSIPCEVPYLKAEPGRVARWAERLGAPGGLRVGLAWAGNPTHAKDRERSIALATLAPLLRVEGVRWFSLQKGPAAEELAAGYASLANLGPELEDFADTAAVISQLDLVICVDTAVAHLAGALGKPVWLMLQKDPDWRWMLEREDSPWYPTMRLFRQRGYGDWSEVIEGVKVALEQRVQGGGGEALPSAAQPVKSTMLRPKPTLARLAPGHKPGFSAVAETRVGIVQYFPDEPVVGDSISWYGEHLQPQLELLGRLLRAGATVLEVGAGVGMHALYLAAAIGPAGRLFLYESRPLMQRVLRQNLEANRVGNVTLMRGALGRAAEGRVTETIDGLQLDQLQLLKIGADAPALEVLGGAVDTLWRLRPLLFIAGRDEAALHELSSHVKDFSYRCWRMETALFNPDNFNRRDNNMFAGGEALALLAIPEEVAFAVPLDKCFELS